MLSLFQDHVVINLIGLEKNSRPGNVRGYLQIQKFSDDPSLCPMATLIEYSNRVRIFWRNFIFNFENLFFQTQSLCDDRSSLFVSHQAPHKPVGSQTLSRWTTDLLKMAGVDVSIFKSHATRAAAAHLHSKSLNCLQICRLANWSTTSGVYQMFYRKYL